LRQGVKVAIVGRPNVGKSSLFNALLNLDRAIVTDIAGTTRDVIKENLDLGVSVTLIDTAGIRDDEGVDKVEEIGIEYSKQSATEADLVLFLYDASVGFTNEDLEIFNIIKDKTFIVVANKIDKVSNFIPKFENTAKLSVYTQDGLEELKQRLKSVVCDFSLEETEFITNKRQQSCLEKCKTSLENALEAAKREELQDMIYIDLKSALLSLDEITGEVINDDILNNIFDHFCIGK
jgi:tRNA modification GTPase